MRNKSLLVYPDCFEGLLWDWISVISVLQRCLCIVSTQWIWWLGTLQCRKMKCLASVRCLFWVRKRSAHKSRRYGCPKIACYERDAFNMNPHKSKLTNSWANKNTAVPGEQLGEMHLSIPYLISDFCGPCSPSHDTSLLTTWTQYNLVITACLCPRHITEGSWLELIVYWRKG